MTANQPLVAAWLSAPPGTSAAIATQPAGALPAPLYVLEGRDGTAARVRLECSRQASGPYVTLGMSVHALQPNELLVTQADVTFRIAAPVGTVLNVQVHVNSVQGCGDGNALWVDVDDDGSIDVDAGTNQVRVLTRVAGVTPLAIRVRSNWIAPPSVCSCAAFIGVQPWHPAAQPAGDGCGNLVTYPQQPFGGTFTTTNYQMAPLPSSDPAVWLELWAFGYGNAGWFVFDQQPTMAPLALPFPWGLTCPVLASPFVAMPGGIGTGVPSFARLPLPSLPSGHVFYVQHAAFSLQAPFCFGTSNRIRLQS